ncbi:MAG: hypothetical protein ACKO26_02545, partial [Planctomycetota bacterium]
TDEGLRLLGSIPSLRRLELNDNPGITDLGASSLAGLSNLSWVDLHATRVTENGAAKLQAALKRGRVVR